MTQNIFSSGILTDKFSYFDIFYDIVYDLLGKR